MTDTSTQRPLQVSTESTAGPYMDVPVSQLDEVERLLKQAGIFYWVNDNLISIDGGPEIATVNFGRSGDAAAVQAILDSVH